MRILWTNHALDQPAGTEIFTRDLVREWRRRGHAVEILCTRSGLMADELRAEGIRVHVDPRALGGKFDLIHGQHFVETAVALAALPGVPALFFCHGDPSGDWIEHPPVHPRLTRWLTTCENLRQHLARVFGREASDIEVVPNPLVLDSLPEAQPIAWPPRKAVVFHNTLTKECPEWEHAAFVCREKGMTLDGLGAGFGNRSLQPWNELAGVDVVFASGRCAMESIAMGKAVVIIGSGRCGGLAGPEDYPALADSNFTRTRKEMDWEAPMDWFDTPGRVENGIARLGAMVREKHALVRVADALEKIHHEVAGTNPDVRGSEEAEANALNFHLAWRQMVASHDEARSGRRKFTRLEEKLARSNALRQQSESRLKAQEAILRRSWWGRRIWRALSKIPTNKHTPS
jgi:hypothetical protein